jgi:ATP-dependent Clp protease protease subunit
MPAAMQSNPAVDPIAERLFKSRTIVISGEINQEVAASVAAQLIALGHDGDAPITVFVNSQGGHVEAGDTIHDIVQFIKPPVYMVGTGWVASIATLIYVAVPVKQRFTLPNTRFLLHEPSGGMGGTAADIAIEAKQIIQMRERLNKMFAAATGQPVERIEEDTRRNFWLDADAAVKYGIAGKVISSVSEMPG